ncbi:MAG TPA: M23 family metallopeptidase [Frankiaceae bacterium]|nr:M23 family metallopeptidase [Frankiaceae bacterium]
MFVRRAAVLLACVLTLGAVSGTAAADPEARAKAQLAALAQRVQDAEAREGTIKDKVTALDRRLAATEREMTGIRARYAARARAAFTGGVGADPVVLMLSASDPNAVVDRLSLYSAATRADDALLRKGTALRRTLRTQRADLEAARRELDRVQRELAQDVRSMRGLLDRLQREDDAREAKAARTSRAMPARASRAARLNGRYACLVGPNHAFRDTWGAPRSGGRTHKGTDVFAPMGSPSYAVTDGVITRMSWSSNGGKQVYLRGNDGNEYFYAHMSSYVAHQGQRVSAGDLIARVGDTGNARGGAPHVHFEVHPGGGYPVNPYPYVRRFCG